ncbi:unnamed protein product [Orchesella dallaii]|uniref:RING-type E3 ubiquitin transferase n=1 Tax=Orchesella dallaii TaxID=48710 RepID=A0ABP1RWY1_9HEXA
MMDLADSDSDSALSVSDSEEYSSFDRSLEVTRSPSQEDILSLLECPVCFDLPLPPIRTCVQGHIICAECCSRLTKCPLCQQRIDIGRNFFAEDFLNRSVIKCRFKVDGCDAELVGEKMKAHAQICEFRPLKCKRCSARVAFSEFESHMFNQHGVGPWDLNDQGVRIVVSQKQRSKMKRGSSTDIPSISMKAICTSLIITAVFTIVADYLYDPTDYRIF